MQGINKKQLNDLGIKNIEISNICTKCGDKPYFSYRKDKKTGRFAGIRARLRTITKPLHDEIELNRLSKAIATGTIDMDSYILFLLRMLAFIEPIEEKIKKMPFWTYSGLDSVIQTRSLFLKEDLEYLGGTTHYGFSDEYMPLFDCPAGAYGEYIS